MRIAHLTDPHLTSLAGVSPFTLAGKRRLGYLSWWHKRRHEHRAEILAEIKSAVAAQAPDVIMVTGDLVHIGLPQEIARAREWLVDLSAISRVILVPGNHDCYSADSVGVMQEQWAEFLNVEPHDRTGFPSLFRRENISIIGLSSAVPVPAWSAGGAIGDPQLSKFERLLRETNGTFRCIGIHHPPLPGQVPRRKALADARALAKVIRKNGVELILHGHVHRNLEMVIDDRTRVMASASASKATTRHRASFRVFDIEADDGHWRVNATLKSLDDSGAVIALSEQTWQATKRRDTSLR